MEMSESIASYGLIGDLQTCALVGDKGNIDWLCWPELDSQACFARLLGEEKHGYWRIAPSGWKTTTRRYLAGTLVLESTYTQTLGARVTVTDFMPMGKGSSAVVRIVRGVKGSVRMQMCLATRFDYGNAQPLLLQESEDCWSAVIGPHRLTMRTNVPVALKEGDLVADWKIKAGETCTFVLQHSNSFLDEPPAPLDAEAELEKTVQHWQAWSARNQYTGPYKQAVERSLLTLKALSYAASGGFVAAPTTSLPERPGGIRNWDYRFCWLRDTELSLTGMAGLARALGAGQAARYEDSLRHQRQAGAQ
jgi:GH15 family glucan-1,4-alpha-glucosidase